MSRIFAPHPHSNTNAYFKFLHSPYCTCMHIVQGLFFLHFCVSSSLSSVLLLNWFEAFPVSFISASDNSLPPDGFLSDLSPFTFRASCTNWYALYFKNLISKCTSLFRNFHLFWGFPPTWKFFTHMERSPLPLKGCKFWPVLGTLGR